MKKTLIESICTILLLAIFLGLIILIVKRIPEFEMEECQKCKSEERQFEGYFTTDWQQDQCRQYEIYFMDNRTK